MKKAKILLICLTLLFSSFAGGCMNYHDADRMTYVTSMLLDVTPDAKPVVYFETFIPVRSAAKNASEASRRLFTVQGDTVSQCLNHLRTLTNFFVTFAHCKVLLISTNAANAGLKNYMDGFVREEDFVNRTRLIIYEGDVANYKNLHPSNERLTGIYLFDLLEEEYPLSVGTQANLLTFVNEITADPHIVALPRVTIAQKKIDNAPSTIEQGGSESQSQFASQPGNQSGTQSGSQSGTQSGGQSDSQSGTQSGSQSGTQSGSQSGTQSGSQSGGQSGSQQENQTTGQSSNSGQEGAGGTGGDGTNSSMDTDPSNVECEVEGITFLNRDHLIESLDQEHAFYYNLMTTSLNNGVIQVPHPLVKGKYVTLGVLHTSKRATSTYKNGVFNYSITIKIKTRFAEAQERIPLNSKTLTATRQAAEKLIAKDCETLFENCQKKNMDIFRMQEHFNDLHPNVKKADILKHTKLTVHVQVTINSTHKAFNWG